MKAREKLVNEHKLIGMLELDGILKKRIGEVEFRLCLNWILTLV
jgi:hypothetical protein